MYLLVCVHFNEINKITNIFSKKKPYLLLHCTSLYPCPLKNVIFFYYKIKKKFKNIEIGFSDHTLGITASLAAVALGAKIIEKHITLNNSMIGPDHKASLNFKNFSKMVEKIREIEKLMGKEVKKTHKW